MLNIYRIYTIQSYTITMYAILIKSVSNTLIKSRHRAELIQHERKKTFFKKIGAT